MGLTSLLVSAVHFVIISIRPAVSVRRELPPPMFAPRLTLNGPSFPPLLILFTQALTAAVAALLRSLLPALPFLVRYINGSGGGAERDGRQPVRPPSVRPSQSH